MVGSTDENGEAEMSRPDRSSDDMYDSRVTGERARAAGRLLDDAWGHGDSNAVAEEGDDFEDDAHLSAEEQAMHLTTAPGFDDDDGYVG